MEWALIGILVFAALISYVIIQGTRAQLKWRELAAAGDVPTIRLILNDQIEMWKEGRVPAGVSPTVWRSIQNMELTEVGADYARVSCDAEAEYRTVDGRRQMVTTPLEQAMQVTAKAADLLLYDLPNLKLARVQIDVYSTFRDPFGDEEQKCILTCTATRTAAREVDWDEWTAQEIVDYFGARYEVDERGMPLPIEVEGERDDRYFYND